MQFIKLPNQLTNCKPWTFEAPGGLAPGAVVHFTQLVVKCQTADV